MGESMTGVVPEVGQAFIQAPAWAPNTNYAAGQLVTQAGAVYAALTLFTSGATFNPANWLQVGVASGTFVAQAPKPAGGDDEANLTAAIAGALAAGASVLQLTAGTYSLPNFFAAGASGWSVTDNLIIRGVGDATLLSFGPDPVPATGGGAAFSVAAGKTLVLEDFLYKGGATNEIPIDTARATTLVQQVGGGLIILRNVRPVGQGLTHGVQANWPAGTREDTCSTTLGSNVITDASIAAGDNGQPVSGPGIPSGSYVGTVTAGVSYLLSSSPNSQVNVNATAANAGIKLTIGPTAASTVMLLDGTDINANGGNGVIVQGTGRFYADGSSRISNFGTAGSNQYHGAYLHSGVSAYTDPGFYIVSTPGVGFAVQVFHNTGVPDYSHFDGLVLGAGLYAGVLTNPAIRSTLRALRALSGMRDAAVWAWGDVDILDHKLACAGASQGSQIRTYSDSTFPRNPDVRVARGFQTGLGVSLAGVTDKAQQGTFDISDTSFDTTSANAFVWANGSTKHADRNKFSDSSGYGSSTTANRPSASLLGKGARWFDDTLNRIIFSDATNWQVGQAQSDAVGLGRIDAFKSTTNPAMVSQSWPAWFHNTNGSATTSGRIECVAVYYEAGDVVSNVGFCSGSTGLTRGSNADSHLWFGIADSSKTVQAVSADDTSTAWAATSLKAAAVTTDGTHAFTIPTSGYYYHFVCVVAGTGGAPAQPTLEVLGSLTALTGNTPKTAFHGTTLQTTPVPVTTVITDNGANSSVPYSYST